MDHDFDNIPSYMEVIEADYDLYGKDTDEDLVVDFIDTDDDGDGTADYMMKSCRDLYRGY